MKRKDFLREIHDDELSAIHQLISRDFEIEVKDIPQSEQEMFDWFANYIADLLQYRTEFVFSLLYRLDVDERLVEQVLHPNAPVPANVGLATLIIERQKERIRTKKEIKQTPIKGWEW